MKGRDVHDFHDELVRSGLLLGGGVRGIYHRSFAFERIARGVEAYVSQAGRREGMQQLFFSQIMASSTLERSGYLSSFPDLIGAVSSYAGGEAKLSELQRTVDEKGDWTSELSPTDLALCSAACHSVYPLISGRPILSDGLYFEVQAFCFRHEPSDDPARMQSFRMHEFVYIGPGEGAQRHRDEWLLRGQELLRALGLTVSVVVANDPFFGRLGQLLASGQREKELKFEIVAPISSAAPGAITSANYHEDHFSKSFDLHLTDGSPAHSSCLGFGLERISLALLLEHGLDVEGWPEEVRALLHLSEH
jgi:seryl-tRNA synthetase